MSYYNEDSSVGTVDFEIWGNDPEQTDKFWRSIETWQIQSFSNWFGNFPFMKNKTDDSIEQYVLHARVKDADYVLTIPADWKTLKFFTPDGRSAGHSYLMEEVQVDDFSKCCNSIHHLTDNTRIVEIAFTSKKHGAVLRLILMLMHKFSLRKLNSDLKTCKYYDHG